jgi:hypothetical protein
MRDALEPRFGGNSVVTSDGKEGEDTETVSGGNVLAMPAVGSRP